MYDNDDGEDEEKALQEALLLSQQPDKPAKDAEEKKAEVPAKDPEPKPTTAEVNIDDDFVNEVINDLGIDVNPNELNDLVNEPKKDEEKKDGDKDKKDKK